MTPAPKTSNSQPTDQPQDADFLTTCKGMTMVMMLCCYVDLRIWKCDSTPQTRACQSRYFLEICATHHSAATSALPRLSLAGAKWAATPPPTGPSISLSLSLSLTISDLFNLYLTYVHPEQVSHVCDESASSDHSLCACRLNMAPNDRRCPLPTEDSEAQHAHLPPLPPRHFEVPSCRFPGGLAYICRRLSESFEYGNVITCVIRPKDGMGRGGEGVLCT